MIGTNNMKTLSMSALLVVATAGTANGFVQPQQRRSVSVASNTSVGPRLVVSQQPKATVLSAASAASDDEDRVLDTEAVAKYAGAIVAQMLLFKGVFTGIDLLSSAVDFEIPFAANFALFYVLALKSRVFNPMSNQRPRRDTKEIEDDATAAATSEPARKMPEWTPPGIVFPIVWILLIGPLRAASSALLVSGASGIEYASPTVLALMLHLSIGDTWNTINNVEKRFGTSVVGVACVWVSAAFAAYSYGQVDPLAGKLLSLPLVWLTIASSLIVRTWQLNPSEATGEKESFLPTKPASQEGSITKLVWFEETN